MRLPHASSVVVALTTFVAVATVAVIVSQVAPLDRAGAALPVPPITSEPGDLDDTPDLADPSSTPVSIDGELDADALGQLDTASPDGAGTTVVTPAPAEPVSDPDPDPDPEPEPAPDSDPTAPPVTPASPGNSGNAPGHGGTSPAKENSNNSGKP